jgi:hypothetical protein
VDLVRTERPGARDSAPRNAIAHISPPCTPTNADHPQSRSTKNSPGRASTGINAVVRSNSVTAVDPSSRVIERRLPQFSPVTQLR